MGRRKDVIAAAAEHVAPFGRRGLDAQAEEAQGRRVENGSGDAERGAHDDRGHHVGQDVAEDDQRIGVADHAGGGDVVGLLDGEDLAAHDAGVLGDGHETDGDDRLVDATAERRHERDRQENRGDGEHHVHEAHDDRVDHAALVAGDRAQRHADRERDRHGEQTDGKRDLAADENAAQPAVEDPYILIDNPSVYTKGRIYPQKFSAQAPGALPEVNVPEAAESDEIQVYVNTTKIEMSHAPVVRDDTVYVDMQQIARCLGMELTEDKSNKSFAVTNENVTANATLDSTSVTINDREYTLTAPPRKIDGTIMVTPNFLNEVLNAKVWWDEAGKCLVITTGEYKKDEILRNIGGKLYMNGEPYYEISFNKFDLFYQIMAQYVPSNQYPSSEYTIEAAEAALKQLNELGFRSIRVFVYSGEFKDLMYNEAHQEIYFKAMDDFFDLCDKYEIKVVVCLGPIS